MQQGPPPLHQRISDLFPQEVWPEDAPLRVRARRTAATLLSALASSALVVLVMLFPYHPADAFAWVALLLCVAPLACGGLLMDAWLSRRERGEDAQAIPLPLRLLLMLLCAVLLAGALVSHGGTVLTHVPLPLRHW